MKEKCFTSATDSEIKSNTMKSILVVDQNEKVVVEAANAGFAALRGDYFARSYQTERSVLMTASNPQWTFGGGIDAEFKRQFLGPVVYKQQFQGDMERIGNICFCITVGGDLKATKEIITSALRFAWANTYDGETLIIPGVGTGIGGLSPKQFAEALKEVIK